MWRWTLIYDGQCRFCQRQVELALGFDVDGRIDAVPFQSADPERFGVSRLAAEEAMHLVAPTGTVWRGAAATREIVRLLPRIRLLAWLFHLPGAMLIAERVYRSVAKRRHRFGCNSSACRRGAAG
ncbi:MAG: hypothetical protein AMS21_06470 [Gemmatimonas sp. SG8_38_2]|nr:MAG: hypothetical protein AMS21_06470 [Gemmatimonas sp. SG8_38_2]